SEASQRAEELVPAPATECLEKNFDTTPNHNSENSLERSTITTNPSFLNLARKPRDTTDALIRVELHRASVPSVLVPKARVSDVKSQVEGFMAFEAGGQSVTLRRQPEHWAVQLRVALPSATADSFIGIFESEARVDGIPEGLDQKVEPTGDIFVYNVETQG